MARWGKADFKELKKLEERMEQLEKTDWDKVCRQVSNQLAQILLKKVKKRTIAGKKPKLDGPRKIKVTGASGKTKTFYTKNDAIIKRYWSGYKGGTLRDAWEVLPVVKHGDQYVITVLNPVEYASYVEYGHRQTPGRYVPALGKCLKASWVKGRFMMTISIQEVETMTPKMLQQAIFQCLKEVF